MEEARWSARWLVALCLLLAVRDTAAASGAVDTGFAQVAVPGGAVIDLLVAESRAFIAVTNQGAVRFFEDGRPDLAFTFQVGAATCRERNLDCTWSAAAAHRDGFVLVGSTAAGDFCVARHLTNGNCDVAFHVPSAATDLGGADSASALAVQADGSVLVAGTVDGAVAFARYTADGALDPDFGAGGTVRTVVRGRPTAVAVQADGRIVVSGFVCLGPVCGLASRYDANGNLDPDFGIAGVAPGDTGATLDAATGLCRTSGCPAGGNFLVAGQRMDTQPPVFLLARYTGAGRFDESFGGPVFPGVVLTRIVQGAADASVATALVQQSDGKLIAGGRTCPAAIEECRFSLARYRENGELDPFFDNDGILVSVKGRIRTLAFQKPGTVLAGGAAPDATGLVVRYLVAECGNGETEPGEQCDEGTDNGKEGSCCDATCLRFAGGSRTCRHKPDPCDPDEVCDGEHGACPPDVVVLEGESCAADFSKVCDGMGHCVSVECGDGKQDGLEECDDGNRVDGDGCDRTCTVTRCGNGVVTGAEVCDPPASQGGSPACNDDCSASVCGDGVVGAGEECDGGACCAPDCQLRGPTEPCGVDTRPCHQQPLCNGREPSCPTVERLADQKSPCLTSEDECVIGFCDQTTGNCEHPTRRCDARARALANGTPEVMIEVVCQTETASTCEAVVRPLPAGASATVPGLTAADEGSSNPIAASKEPVTTRPRKKSGTPLPFKKTLVLPLNKLGKQLLRKRNVNAQVFVTIREGETPRHLLPLLVKLRRIHGFR